MSTTTPTPTPLVAPKALWIDTLFGDPKVADAKNTVGYAHCMVQYDKKNTKKLVNPIEFSGVWVVKDEDGVDQAGGNIYNVELDLPKCSVGLKDGKHAAHLEGWATLSDGNTAWFTLDVLDTTITMKLTEAIEIDGELKIATNSEDKPQEPFYTGVGTPVPANGTLVFK